MKAIILAAGTGTRLRPITNNMPKCLVELDGVSLIDRQKMALNECGINNICVVAGYKAEMITAKGYDTYINSDYDITNMVATLFCATEQLSGDEDIIISYGDIVYEPKIVKRLLECSDPICLVIDKEWKSYWQLRMDNPLKDAETLKLDENGYIKELGKIPKCYNDIEGQYIGLIKIRGDYIEYLCDTYNKMDRDRLYDGKTFQQMYMTSFIQYIIDSGCQVKSVPISNGWLEVDTISDYKLYEYLISENKLHNYYKT